MAYTYSDYITLGYTQAGLTRVRLFIHELTDITTASVSDAGKSRDAATVLELKRDAEKWMHACEMALGVAPGSPRVGSADLRGWGGR